MSSWFLLNPYVRMMTELLSSTFLSLIVTNKSLISFCSVGAPSVRNKMTLFLFFPEPLATDPCSRSNAFSKAGLNFVNPGKQQKYDLRLIM